MYINADKEESAAIDGLAIHWYTRGYFEDVAKAHEIQPDKFILSTEACSAYLPDQHFPLMGDWQRGEDYGHDILNGLKNWVIGWTDWNLVLDQKGGPNWVMNSVDAAILVNKDADEFYKQPMYYFLGHFSKFIPRDSVRISSETTDFNLAGNLGDQSSVEHVAFWTPDGHTVLVVMNTDKKNSFRLSMQDVNFEGKFGQIVLPPNSIITAIWKQ
uniref:Glucosylceramidase n=1 Tax=Ditylenchus dipsaci TaxID=166011 RepID=A0A915EQN3_9BILA